MESRVHGVLRRPSTWSIVAIQTGILPVDAVYARPVDIIWLYHVTVSVALVVEPSLLQARRSGTLYRTVFATRRSAAAATASGNKADFFNCYSVTFSWRKQTAGTTVLYGQLWTAFLRFFWSDCLEWYGGSSAQPGLISKWLLDNCWKPFCSRLFRCSYRARLCDN